MENNDLTQLIITTLIGPLVTGLLMGGGLVAYINYRLKKPEAEAQAKNINVTAEISLAKEWREYAKNVEVRLDTCEINARKQIEQVEIRYKAEIKELEKEIQDLRDQIVQLSRRRN